MRETTELIAPACTEACDNCSLHCAMVAMLLTDLRRDQELLLREVSRGPQSGQREELKIVEGHLVKAAQAFERVRPRRDRSPRFRVTQPLQMSARLH